MRVLYGSLSRSTYSIILKGLAREITYTRTYMYMKGQSIRTLTSAACIQYIKFTSITCVARFFSTVLRATSQAQRVSLLVGQVPNSKSKTPEESWFNNIIYGFRPKNTEIL